MSGKRKQSVTNEHAGCFSTIDKLISDTDGTLNQLVEA